MYRCILWRFTVIHEDYFIRPASINDAEIVFKFINEKSSFDKKMKAFKGDIKTNKDLIINTMLGKKKYAFVILSEYGNIINGMAIYYFRYSSFSGRPILWLEDLYVPTDERNKGIGSNLMEYLKCEMLSNKCSCISWTASINNYKGIAFYKKIGAKALNCNDDKLVFSMKNN